MPFSEQRCREITTTKGRKAAIKAWQTRRHLSAWEKAHAAEAASKAAFTLHFEKQGWRVAFFEGKTRAPRTSLRGDSLRFHAGVGNGFWFQGTGRGAPNNSPRLASIGV